MMEAGYVALGILSVLYYVCLICHTKKLNSSFSIFWLLFGVWNFGVALIVSITPTWFDYLLLVLSAMAWVVFGVVELVVLSAMLAIPKKELEYIIILGAQIRGKKITNALERRLKKGIHYLKENPKTHCIVSGGRGKGEDVTEAEAMAEYLILNGIEKERILLEDKSKTTWQNLEFCQSFIRSKEMIGIVTNNFHIYRAMKIAEMQGYKKIYAIPASTNLIVFPNYMTREFFALIKLFLIKKK